MLLKFLSRQSRQCYLPVLEFVCLFSLLLNVPFHTLVYFRDGSAQTILRAATLRQKLQIKAFHLTQSQYTDTGPTSPRADPITPGAWQGSHWNANVYLSHWYDSTPKEPSASRVHIEISRSRGGRLTRPPTRWCARVIFRYFLSEAVGSAKGLYFLHLCVDLNETLEERLKMNILLSHLIVIFKKWQRRRAKLPGIRQQPPRSPHRPVR